MLRVLGICITLACAQAAHAQNHILCKRKDDKDVIVSLADFTKFNRVFNCVSGDFIVDLSGCAPAGGYGLHAISGASPLIGVADRWQDYADHLGGLTSNWVSSREIGFTGGYYSKDNGRRDDWTFVVNRLTGEAELTVKEKPAKTYACRKVRAKF